MKRRDFLYAAAGGATALAAPFGMRPARAETTARPRFLFIVEGNGYEPVGLLSDSARAAIDETLDAPIADARFWTNRYRHGSPLVLDTPDLSSALSLHALGEQDLIDQATVLYGLSSRIIGGSHSAQHGVLSSTRTVGGQPGGPTIDAYLAKLPSVRRSTPFEAFRTDVAGGPVNFGTCAYGAGDAAPMSVGAAAAYELAYGAFADDGDARAAFEARERMLRFAARDVGRAEREFSGSAGERSKLGTYGGSIRELLDTQEKLRTMRSSVVAPPAPPATEGTLPGFAALIDLAVSALVDGLTSVSVVGCGTGGPAFSDLLYPTIPSVRGSKRHTIEHGAVRDPGLLAGLREIRAIQLAAIAAGARRLADEGLLDTTVIVWVGDNGEQHHSTASEFPILLIGGSGLGLARGGRTIVYPGAGSDSNRQVSNLWNTLGHIAGERLDEFGGEVGGLRKAPGPLPELLV